MAEWKSNPEFAPVSDTPAVSVILPVYNAEATIDEAVASVLGQSFRDLELIVIDDGSTDGTLEVLGGIDDSRLILWSTAQSGPSASRNRGIERARADIIAFIDADDMWLPGKLEAQLAAFEQDPQAAAIYGWTDYVDGAGRFVGPDRRPIFEGRVHEQFLTENFIDSGSNIMIRKQALEAVGGFDEALPVVEDWDLYIRLAARYAFACVPTVLVLYRLSSTSLTTDTASMEASYHRMVDRAFAEVPESLHSLKRKNAARFYEYMTTKSAQGCPTRQHGLQALRFFVLAARNQPLGLMGLWRRPWVIKAMAKALLSIALPATAMQRLVLAWPARSLPSGQNEDRPHHAG